MRVGDNVRLVTPENSRLDGAVAIVNQIAEWGAYCNTSAAATGQFRALWSEMELASEIKLVSSNGSSKSEYTGEFCVHCGSSNMRRTGTCKVCEDCGESGGC